MMKNKQENNTTISFLSFVGIVQIILIVIRLFGGLKDWPIAAVLLPSIVALITLFICIIIAFVLICIGLISMNKRDKE